LEGVALDESRLQGMELFALRQALDRRDLTTLGQSRKPKAGFDALSVHQHGAGPTLAEATALLCTRQAEVLAQGIEQGRARIDSQPLVRSIDAEHDLKGGRRRLVCLRRRGRHGCCHEVSSCKEHASGNAGARDKLPFRQIRAEAFFGF
jgi:hypothetical protein